MNTFSQKCLKPKIEREYVIETPTTHKMNKYMDSRLKIK